MEISVRDWMIIIGVLLIVAVLLDGYRRMRDPNRIRVSLTKVPDGPEDDVGVSHELPNGGARVKPRGERETEEDSGVEHAPDRPAGPHYDDADTVADTVDAAPAPAPAPGADSPTAKPAAAEEPPLLTERADSPAVSPEPDPLFDAPRTPLRARRDGAGETLDLLDGISTADDVPGQDQGREAPQEVLMLHVVSRDPAGFPGEDILQVLLAYNLRFGEMDFFHRHEGGAGRGAIQFSVANMLKPGVFDIDRMSDFSTTGLIFFLTLPGPKDMMGAFELMLDTARGVAEHLGGDVLDESRSATTRQTLEHMRQRIRDLERKLLAQAQR